MVGEYWTGMYTVSNRKTFRVPLIELGGVSYISDRKVPDVAGLSESSLPLQKRREGYTGGIIFSVRSVS